MLNVSPCIGPLPPAFAQAVRVQATGRQPVLFEDLDPEAKTAALQYVFDDEAPVEWSEEDVVLLHWRLLQELAVLENPCWIESRLAKNPQWINEEIKKHTVQGDLFA